MSISPSSSIPLPLRSSGLFRRCVANILSTQKVVSNNVIKNRKNGYTMSQKHVKGHVFGQSLPSFIIHIAAHWPLAVISGMDNLFVVEGGTREEQINVV